MVIGYVFGYGSLAHSNDWAMQGLHHPARYTFLEDHRRTWDVGIDNEASLYDHKHYREKDGSRAKGVVSTLGIYSNKGSFCNGVLIPVDSHRLDLIDKREHSYNRKDVSRFCTSETSLPVWTYFPDEEALETYKNAKELGIARLPKSYLDFCTEAFRSWRGLHSFWESTDRPTCPEDDLWLQRKRGLAGV